MQYSKFHKQFEAVAALNDWNMEHKAISLALTRRGKAAKMLNGKDMRDRFGEGRLEQVFAVKKQGTASEGLQEFESNLERMVRIKLLPKGPCCDAKRSYCRNIHQRHKRSGD